ncbi:crotonobetainyl-CoA:carnitine CoA-transferase [Campylobacter pinnipediorum subsp. pinnipediorum]|uniref:L-carnitine CoA-transferase n=1 Tax=Campylobacter pinnipediorum TaxID=1965231 RepID=UPI000994A491|nr:L-carnitine CoA-transferase [Campylobacter pinnipediorum]AQW80747.1 crotonobetainyl-CoA:carnitine CoA-transferase [Campylobacter pinnipediorum subsp. pinnipediorum]
MKFNTPKFGPLSGVKVVFSAMEIAGPFSAQILAEWGAEVIWIENSKYPDTIRVQENYKELSRRNLYALSLNLFSEEGKEVFYKLIKECDIFIEASKGPAFAKKGITDEVLWSHNKKLVIAHLSGFGQYGDPEYTNLAAYNTIAQAFSGYLIQNGDQNQPMPAFPYTADYLCGLTVTSSVLAALHNAQKTGVGESIDVAMYETMLRMGQYYMMDYLNGGEMCPRMIKGKDPLYAGCGLYSCKDGYIVFEIVGVNQVKEMFNLIGISKYYGTDDVPEGTQLISRKMKVNDEFEAALDRFFKERSIEESLKVLSDLKVAGAKVLEVSELQNNPQYIARDSFTTWKNSAGKDYTGPNIMPKFKNNPGKIWRAMPDYGEDTADIMSHLGYSEVEITKLNDEKIIKVRK